MTQALTFRFATLSDADAITANVERAYRSTEASEGWTTESHLFNAPRLDDGEVAGFLSNPDCRFVLAEHAGEICASALIQKEPQHRAYFGMFAVAPAFQAGGIGRAMLSECEARVRALWGAASLHMSVISLRHELIAWYKRRGYEDRGERKPFPFHLAPGALRQDFDLIILEKSL